MTTTRFRACFIALWNNANSLPWSPLVDSTSWRSITSSFLVAAALLLAPTLLIGPDAAQAQDQVDAPPSADGTVIVYFLDHQFLPDAEVDLLREEVAEIFEQAGLALEWVVEDSPRRDLYANELRLIILPSDGTRWFHGPSNVIGIAPHDDDGTGRNCFVFYRQAIWFRQQAVFRCREAIQARTEAQIRGIELDPFIEAYAPADCGNYLPSLTAMMVNDLPLPLRPWQ